MGSRSPSYSMSLAKARYLMLVVKVCPPRLVGRVLRFYASMRFSYRFPAQQLQIID
jgi:hypothetical protein